MTLTLASDGLELADGVKLPLIGGSVQYWRIARSLWPAILDNVCAMGFHLIETYVPWSVHEVERGVFDFGADDSDKDLAAFLNLCQERGIFVVLRPGPNIIAELTYYGFPKRILDDPEIQAQTHLGTVALYDFPIKQAPVPSYASEKLYEEFSAHLDATFEVIRPLLYPQGPVIGLQADNELSFFFRLSAFDLDYAPASLDLYRQFLAGRYEGAITALNASYRSAYRDFSEVAPPRCFAAQTPADLAPYFDWAEYKEYYLLHAMRRVTALLRERIPAETRCLITHNYPGLVGQFPLTPYSTPYDLTASEEELDICGVDSYPFKEGYARLKGQVQVLAAASRLPYIPEFGSGAWPWMRPLLVDDHEFTTLTALMHGIKALNFYMLVERDRWIGAPITRDNRVRSAHYELYRHLNQFLETSKALSYQKEVRVLLLANRDYERLASISTLFTPPSRQFLVLPYPEIYLNEETLGFRRSIPLAFYQWWQRWTSVLTEAGCTYDIGDTGLPLERLNRYDLVITPTFDFLDRTVEARLLDFTGQGGRLLAGPDRPYLDRDMAAHSGLAAADDRAGRVLFLSEIPSAGNLTRQLEEWGLAPEIVSRDASLDVAVHRREAQKRIYLANPTSVERTACLDGAVDENLHDLWSDQVFSPAAITMPPYTIRILEEARS